MNSELGREYKLEGSRSELGLVSVGLSGHQGVSPHLTNLGDHRSEIGRRDSSSAGYWASPLASESLQKGLGLA